MKPSDREWIEKRAYSLWEEEGKPHGKDDAHWEQAHAEFLTLSKSAEKAKSSTRKRVSQAAKTRQSPEAEMADVPADPKPVAAPKRKRKAS